MFLGEKCRFYAVFGQRSSVEGEGRCPLTLLGFFVKKVCKGGGGGTPLTVEITRVLHGFPKSDLLHKNISLKSGNLDHTFIQNLFDRLLLGIPRSKSNTTL